MPRHWNETIKQYLDRRRRDLEEEEDQDLLSYTEPISLRDFIAGCALNALIQTELDDLTYKNASRESYKYADALLAAREERMES